jgi:hypothetical protein
MHEKYQNPLMGTAGFCILPCRSNLLSSVWNIFKFCLLSDRLIHVNPWLHFSPSIFNWNILVTGHKQQSAFSSTNHCQGQLQTHTHTHSLSLSHARARCVCVCVGGWGGRDASDYRTWPAVMSATWALQPQDSWHMTSPGKARNIYKHHHQNPYYSEPLWLPEFFAPPPPLTNCTDATDFTSLLWLHIGKLWPTPASRHAVPPTFIFKDLAAASHVFLLQGILWEALQAPYVDPYRVCDAFQHQKRSTTSHSIWVSWLDLDGGYNFQMTCSGLSWGGGACVAAATHEHTWQAVVSAAQGTTTSTPLTAPANASTT